jgi:uncharacterized repeat protein (TIGR01451 family)
MLRPALLAALFAALAVPAALAASLTATQSVERRVMSETPDGKVDISWVAADQAIPGDVMRYAMNYSNGGTQKAENVVLVVPVPDAMRYVENSATMNGVAVTFSVDDGRSFASRGELLVNADGRKVSAEAGDITHVRWTFPAGIAGGETGTVSFEAVLK